MSVGLPPLLLRKLTARVRLLDRDDDGRVDRDDYAHLALSRAVATRSDAERRAQALEIFTTMFERLAARYGSGPEGTVTLAAFLESMARNVVARPDGLDRALGRACRITFRLGAGDADRLPRASFVRLYTAVGVPRPEADRAFLLLGRDELTFAEFRDTSEEFYRGNDPRAPANWLYGDF